MRTGSPCVCNRFGEGGRPPPPGTDPDRRRPRPGGPPIRPAFPEPPAGPPSASSWTAGTIPSRPGRKAHNCCLSGGAGGVSPEGPERSGGRAKRVDTPPAPQLRRRSGRPAAARQVNAVTRRIEAVCQAPAGPTIALQPTHTRLRRAVVRRAVVGRTACLHPAGGFRPDRGRHVSGRRHPGGPVFGRAVAGRASRGGDSANVHLPPGQSA